jgi:hypothetical protein
MLFLGLHRFPLWDWISSTAVLTDWDKNEWLLRCADGCPVVFTPGGDSCATHNLAFISDEMDLIPMSQNSFWKELQKCGIKVFVCSMVDSDLNVWAPVRLLL